LHIYNFDLCSLACFSCQLHCTICMRTVFEILDIKDLEWASVTDSQLSKFLLTTAQLSWFVFYIRFCNCTYIFKLCIHGTACEQSLKPQAWFHSLLHFGSQWVVVIANDNIAISVGSDVKILNSRRVTFDENMGCHQRLEPRTNWNTRLPVIRFLEFCQLSNADLCSLVFTFNRLFIK